MWQSSVVNGLKRQGGKQRGGTRRTGLVVLAIFFGTTTAAVIVARLSHLGVAQTLVAVLVGGGTLAGLYLAWATFLADQGKSSELRLEEVADQLAIAVGTRGAHGPGSLAGGVAGYCLVYWPTA
jgi:hypothetical protein